MAFDYNITMEADKSKKIFMVIDGSAIIHRAYHAMPAFTTQGGTPTGAVFGFFSMLLKLIQEIKPAYIAVAFDRAAPTFRQKLYVGYQAQRPSVSDDLAGQFEIVREILADIGIPVYEVDGFEADDVIGTIAGRLKFEMFREAKLPSAERNSKFEIIIVTGDRDMLQLIDSDTKVLMPVKGISEVMLFDRARVEEKYGVKPEQIIDYKALIGDASDNYPGVAGVGPKTAASLLSKYGSFEEVYNHISKIEKNNKSLAEKLANGAEQAALAKKLATLDCNVPFIFDHDKCSTQNLSGQKFEEAFKKYQFRTLTKRAHEVFGNSNNGKKSQMKLL